MLSKKIMLAMQLLTVASQVYRLYKMRGMKERLRIKVNQEREKFRSLTVTSSQPFLTLDAATATVVLEEIIGIDADDLLFTLYARNHAGEYFMLKSSGGKQFVKHVPHNVAKAVLKEKYIGLENP